MAHPILVLGDPSQAQIKLFFWLCANDKLLTWESLRRKGWQGPGYCVLCHKASEDLSHLFINCSFVQALWDLILKHLSLTFIWTGDSFLKCFSSWYKDQAAPPSLAVFVCWHVWLERNRALFEDSSPFLQSAFYRTLASFQWKQIYVNLLLPKAVDTFLPEGYSVAFFDGAALASGTCCGAGGTFRSHPHRLTKWFINCGRGSNTKAELLGLWATLLIASCWSLNHLHVIGDSKVIIDWINN